MSPRAGQAGHPARTLAFVESPVQLLNVLEWAHLHGLRDGAGPTHRTATPPTATPPTATDPTATPRTAPGAADRSGPAEPPGPAGAQLTGGTSTGSSAAAGPSAGFSAASGPAGGPAGGPSADAELTVVVLSPTDPMTRGQLRRMADLARDEGHRVRWEEARGGTTAPFHTIGGLAGPRRRADRIGNGDPVARNVPHQLTNTRAPPHGVGGDGTAPQG
ncbi:hypothetical protein ACWGKX_39380, partial [Streptomyces tricolor]